MRQRTINNLIEISPQAEGSFLTQAFPTNFHQFYTKKLLTPQESVSDYKEVTAAEKANIINADSQWVEPSEELKVTAKAVGADYNYTTGYFELNTLTDITTEQMRAILKTNLGATGNFDWALCGMDFRTNALLPPVVGYTGRNYEGFAFGTEAEILNITKISALSVNYAFSNCRSLKKIIGQIILAANIKAIYSFCNNCGELEEISLQSLRTSLSLKDCAKLSLASIQYMVDNAANTSPITITLHPDAHARLTEELIAQAAEKQITFATTS